MKARRIKGAVRSELTVTNQGKEVHHESRTKETKTVSGEQFAVIKFSTSVKVAHGFQTVGMDIGVEMPWQVDPGDVDGLKGGFEEVYAFVDSELAERAKEIDGLVRDLAKKYRR